MWQRIQTVFLGITILALGVSLVQPVWLAQTGSESVVLTPFYLLKSEQYQYMPYALTAMFALAGMTLAIISIKRYDNRGLQIKLGLLNTLILVAAMGSVFFFSTQLNEQYPVGRQNGLGMYMIFAAVLCNWLALRFIRRDEQLVKDSDRIR